MCDDSVIGDDVDREEWDSGPFCRHWSDPSDCNELCKCGHKCSEHAYGDYCVVDDCTCDGFDDAK